MESYIDSLFEVVEKADNTRYANGNDIRSVNLGPIASFSYLKLTTGSGKHLEDISNAHIVFSLYKLLTLSRSIDVLSIGFGRYRERRQQELPNNKNIQGSCYVRVVLKDSLEYAEHQEKAT